MKRTENKALERFVFLLMNTIKILQNLGGLTLANFLLCADAIILFTALNVKISRLFEKSPDDCWSLATQIFYSYANQISKLWTRIKTSRVG